MGNKNNIKKTLVIMAAGMASRYGGDKQTDGVGPRGETLMEYSIYDAIRAGFRKIVLIIRPDAKEMMDARFGDKIRNFDPSNLTGDNNINNINNINYIKLDYAYQDFSSIPAFYQIPKERVKPFGTGHALLCAADVVQEPFCVMNADDYYGADAFRVMSGALDGLPASGQAVMVGYILKNTLSESGTVSRGICEVNPENDNLIDITERLKIGYDENGVLRDADSGVLLSPDDIASMNLWGFAPSFFADLREYFEYFLREQAGDNIKAECQLPTAVKSRMAIGKLRVKVLRSQSSWFGMTYQKDREIVAGHLRELRDKNIYPENLWKVSQE